MKYCWIIALSVLSLAISATQARASSIHELKIEGLPSDQVETVKTLSGLLPGDEVDSNRINRGVERIHDYFESKGFPQAKITPEVSAKGDKASVHIKVVPGEPVRMLEVAYLAKEGNLPDDLKLRLSQVIEIKPGEPMDRDRLKDIKRTIESTLANLNFVDSRVVDVTTESLEKGVRVVFTIELGERVIFSVYGSEYFTRTELMTIIEEQTLLGLGRDFISVIQSRLLDHYIEYGFRHAEVTPYVFEAKGNTPRKVAYKIHEGSKVLIHSVTFDGNEAFTDDQLENLFYKNASDRIQAHIYNGKMVESASALMIEELKRRGYLSSKLIAVKSEESKDQKQIDIRLFVSEGLQTRVQAIEFHGNRAITSDKLLSYLGMKEGDPLNLSQLEDGIDRMKREYRNLGYLDVKISNETGGQLVTYSEKNQYAYLTFNFDEGSELRLSGVKIYGNETTRAEVILRELQIQEGDPLAEDKMLETEERLRRLGVFNQVKLELTSDTGSELTRNMKISVVEGIPGNAGVGFGFRNDLGLRVFGEVSYSNLWGLNHGWALNMSANRRLGGFLSTATNRLNDFRFYEFEARLSYFWPYVFLGETNFRPNISAERRQYINFDAETYAFNLALDRMFYKPVKLSGGLGYTLERVNQFNAVNPIDNQQVRIGSITPSLRLDLRDNPLAPRKGFYAFTSFEFSDAIFGSQTDPDVAYGRFQVRTDYYIDFIPRVIWYTSLRGGWLKNYSKNSEVGVPLIKQFALGGVNSLRGFLDQELNIQAGDGNATKVVQGSSTYVNYRVQMDFLASQNLTFGPFLDAGNLLLDDFSFGKLRYGTGVGLRYITPVGPVNFDWGFKLFPHPGEETNVFYFSLGVI
ncbi:MAG: BamA/TamA family outer membrane protein [Bdellovibrionales bacterium]|nr:BamA/TamA family outer membrane protein [Bdellovibrionales bacterium]